MGIRAWFLTVAATVAAATTGCYVDETIDDRPPGAPGDKSLGRPVDDQSGAGNCHHDLNTGCFDGHIVSMQPFYVDGLEFQNADALAPRFAELITVADDEGATLTAGVDFELQLLTAIDNRNFLAEFSYDLVGRAAKGAKIRTDGNFSVNDLPEGSYDLRVQRPVRFEVVREVTSQGPDGEPRLEKRTKSHCATIYADSAIDIRAGVQAYDNFNDFRLYVTDYECSGKSSGTTLSVPD